MLRVACRARRSWTGACYGALGGQMFRYTPKLCCGCRRYHQPMSRIPSAEPRFARIAAAMSDPTRARMLSALLNGMSLPAGEIAQAAGVNASTASQHLALLVDEGLVAV